MFICFVHGTFFVVGSFRGENTLLSLYFYNLHVLGEGCFPGNYYLHGKKAFTSFVKIIYLRYSKTRKVSKVYFYINIVVKEIFLSGPGRSSLHFWNIVCINWKYTNGSHLSINQVLYNTELDHKSLQGPCKWKLKLNAWMKYCIYTQYMGAILPTEGFVLLSIQSSDLHSPTIPYSSWQGRRPDFSYCS